MKLGATTKPSISAVIFLLLALSMLAFSAPTAAQSAVVIETMRVDIWPEYDKPGVLVIYHITLSAATALPADLSIRIPAAVGEPHAVAMQDPNGLYNRDYRMATAGEWEEIQFNTPLPEVRIEYYDPGLSKTGTARSYTFNWPGDIMVNNLSLVVQQPAGATNMVLKPGMGSGSQAEDGLTYFSYVAGKVPAGTTFTVSVSYEKADNTLTSAGQFQTAQPSQPVNESAAGRMNWGQVLPWTLGGLGLLLIAAGVFYYFRTGRGMQAAPRHRHPRSANAEENRQDGSFCQQCGKRAAVGDVFCRACGTKLR